MEEVKMEKVAKVYVSNCRDCPFSERKEPHYEVSHIQFICLENGRTVFPEGIDEECPLEDA